MEEIKQKIKEKIRIIFWGYDIPEFDLVKDRKTIERWLGNYNQVAKKNNNGVVFTTTPELCIRLHSYIGTVGLANLDGVAGFNVEPLYESNGYTYIALYKKLVESNWLHKEA